MYHASEASRQPHTDRERLGHVSSCADRLVFRHQAGRLDPEQDSFLAPEEDSERDAESGNEEMESKSVAKRAESGDGFRHAHGHLLGKGLDTSYETMLNERALSILFENTWWESHFDEGHSQKAQVFIAIVGCALSSMVLLHSTSCHEREEGTLSGTEA